MSRRIQLLEIDDDNTQDERKQLKLQLAALMEKAFDDAKALLNEVRWAMSANSNTMKMGINPETDELSDTERVLDPIKVDLDGRFYGRKS